MDRKLLGLGIALTYPQLAFAGEEPSAILQSRTLVERAGRGEAVTPEVADMLSRHPRLNEWVEQLLEDRDLVPPHLQHDEVRSYAPLPGRQGKIEAPRYVCLRGDGFTWYRFSVADTIPACTFCGSALSPA